MSGRNATLSLKTSSPPDDFHARRPVNKTAALVIGPGVRFSSIKRIAKGTLCSNNPLEIRPPNKCERNNRSFVNMSGKTVGRLKCIGIIADGQGYQGWLMRCSCGRYTNRSAKAIRNKNNTQDRCEECRHVLHLKRTHLWRTTGIDRKPEEII